jgi:glucose dehydrogenase
MNMRAFFRPVSLALLILPIAFGQSAKERNAATEWRTYNHDLAGTRFSPLSQINTSNVTRLTQAWVYRPAATGARPSPEVTPIVVNGVMYLTAGNRVIALEPETGKEVWRYDVQNGPASQRGVAYWPGDRDHPPRILFTAGRQLIALNAVTGEASTGFGNNGKVDMTVGYGGVPTIYKNVAMVGAAVGEYIPLGPPGDSRGFDIRDGKKLWDFHSVPRPGEPGRETWEADSWKDRSGVNVWGFQMTVDEQRGIVYMTFGAPTSTYYGGDRKGDNLFANSVVAIDAETGKYRAEGAAPRSSIIFPGSTGGTNWGGTASDPRSGYVYGFTQNVAFIGWMQKMPPGYVDALTREASTVPYDRGSEAGPGPYQQFTATATGPDGRPVQGGSWPCQKPPWGQLSAINANTGDIAWQVTVGVTDELPEGKRNTGRLGLAGPTVTGGGLVFLGATSDNRFRAFDARSGKELWAVKLDYAANAIPITFQGKNGKQYVAVMSSGGASIGAAPGNQELIVFSLP